MVQVIEGAPKHPLLESLGAGLKAGAGVAAKLMPKLRQEQALRDFSKQMGLPETFGFLPPNAQNSYLSRLKIQQDREAMRSVGAQLKTQHPDNPLYQAIGNIYESGVDPQGASQLVRSIAGVDPFRMRQQERLQLDSVLKRYSQRLKELDAELKEFPNRNSSGKAAYEDLKAQRDALRAERDQLLGFQALGGYEEEEAEPELEEQDFRVRFNPKSPTHMNKFRALDKKFKGDRARVNAALAKEFTL
jgi:hypothetical protein